MGVVNSIERKCRVIPNKIIETGNKDDDLFKGTSFLAEYHHHSPHLSPIILRISFLFFLLIFMQQLSFAQFSPGELSRAHQQLEGTSNCTQCHEVGNEISGKKCLACHSEIKTQLDGMSGFHFVNSAEQCVTCHKEHLGKKSHTFNFDAKTFNHNKTGFALSGKHEKVKCDDCHIGKNIHNEDVLKRLTDFPHKSYIGLSQTCASCHEDTHEGKFKQDCSSCHTLSGWKPASKFDHSKSTYRLEGKHASVECSKCHSALKATDKRIVQFMTKTFTDCTPCHTTPHGSKLTGKDCKSCHATESWQAAMKKKFDHNMTTYPLVGKHIEVKCEKCHLPNKRTKSGKPLRLAHDLCTDCHKDKHDGEFKVTYNNDCKKCHNELGFKPTLFTLTTHQETKFKLTGSHNAVLCVSCHKIVPNNPIKFTIEKFNCESCHKNPHGKEFSATIKEKNCESCHSTEQWKSVTFDHSTTKFQLLGKHQQTRCDKCHKGMTEKDNAFTAPTDTTCESCHKDKHEKQFLVMNKTECGTCHKPDNWKMLIFNHETQSSFSLKGGHSKVECHLCHREEEANGVKFVRYKPLSSQCESCHQKKN